MTTKTTINEDGVQVGDIFVASWGYDQTNITSVQVVRVTARSAEIVNIRNEGVYDLDRDQTYVKPVKDSFNPDTAKRELKRTSRFKFRTGGHGDNTFEETVTMKMASYATYYLWDGERSFYDTIAAGHPGH